jgi:transcriptional regulator with XRE-family HTH domain
MKRARLFADLQIKQLAGTLGMSAATLSRIENGHQAPSRRDLMAYQVLTGFRWEWLETGGGEPFVELSGRMRSRRALRLAA